jgi:hypothetical protein
MMRVAHVLAAIFLFVGSYQLADALFARQSTLGGITNSIQNDTLPL